AVVQGRGEVVDVVPVEWGHERLVDPAEDGVSGIIGEVLGVFELFGQVRPVRGVRTDQLSKEIRACDEVGRESGEEVKERGVTRGDTKTHRLLRQKSKGSNGIRVGQICLEGETVVGKPMTSAAKFSRHGAKCGKTAPKC